ncbi:MAG: UbiA family prenyltransferase, partial [Desulfobacterota bacterium]|nr:UbiA family prenyltransferase [Thermodesulfobacteriota bacterium]
DTPDRLGPTRVTAAGLISPGRMRLATAAVFALALLPGLYLVWLRGWPVLALGIALVIAALAYTGGPFPYGYHALGEVFVFLTFGVAAVCGTYYVQAGTLSATIGWASVAPGLLIVNILVVNNTRISPRTPWPTNGPWPSCSAAGPCGPNTGSACWGPTAFPGGCGWRGRSRRARFCAGFPCPGPWPSTASLKGPRVGP